MSATEQARLIEAIGNIPDAEWEKAMARYDQYLARTERWAWKDCVGTWPTKADKGL